MESEIKMFIKHFHENIVQKWTDFFVLHKKPKNECITKRLD
jgi:hypothetical protein